MTGNISETTNSPAFVHLHLHTEFSVVDSLLHIPELINKVGELGQVAVAMTDQSNSFGLVKFYNQARRAGIKPIIGADLWVEAEGSAEVFRVSVLCQNQQGFLNLSHLLSRAHLENQQVVKSQQIAVVNQAWLRDHSEGLILLLGRESDLGTAILAGNSALISQLTEFYQTNFPTRFYLELVRTGRPQEETFIQSALSLSQAQNIPVVATNDVRFLVSDDFEAHEVRCCINGGYVLEDPNRPRPYSEQQYLRSTEEMQALFQDIPSALENTVLIAKRCNLELGLGTYYLPNYPIPDGMTMDEFFTHESEQGLQQRLDFLFGHLSADEQQQKADEYYARLKFELDTIIQMGFPGYFLIVADFIQWAKNHAIPVGPGRGSGAGSLVAYALKITDIDPIEYDLLFERFLNPERISMPDFDVDFCMERRDEVIDYVAQNYGRDHVSQIVTFGTMAAKAVVRDVGRVLGNSYGMVDGVAKLIPNELGIKLKDALKEEDLQQRYQEDEEVKQLLDLGLKLEGTVRNLGRHAGGVVIGPKPLEHFCPLYSEMGGRGVVTQLDKDDVESIGLVKFDFLGLRTLTIIDWALQAINQGKKQGDEGFVDITRISLEDRPTFDLIKTGRTTGIFQLESSGMQDLIRRLQPDKFEDIVALVALFRPGPLDSGMVDNFIARKHGREKVSYPDAQYQHESLQPVLEPTYGIILYQEQVMQIAQVLSGYTLGGADMLRRAMGKKKPEEMAKERSKFEAGAIKNGIDAELAMKIFDLVEKFAGYGFNKSHSAAYALVSYQSAWLKTHYPAHFMAAQISSDMDNTEKVVHMINECYSMGLNVISPDVNLCDVKFKATDDNTVLYGLGAIKGVGETALEDALLDRQQNGPFKDLFDFTARAGKKINRRALEALAKAGAFDNLHPNRSHVLASISLALQQANQQQEAAASGQEDLFGSFDDPVDSIAPQPDLVVGVALSDKEILRGEKEVLGLYLSGHPIESYRQELQHYVAKNLNQLTPNRYEKIWVAGLVAELRTKTTKSGARMAFVCLDDKTARLEAVLRPALYDAVRDQFAVDDLVLMYGAVEEDSFNGGLKFSPEQVVNIAEMRAQKARALKLFADSKTLQPGMVAALSDLLAPFKTDTGLALVVEYQNAEASGQVKAGFEINPADELLEALQANGWKPEVVF